jgi:hypothetical protein
VGVAEHNNPYGRRRRKEGKGYSASVAPEAVIRGEGEEPGVSDARADVWSWGVLLHALVTRSTAVAKGGSPSEYLTTVQGKQWYGEAMVLSGSAELPRGVFEAVQHSLCERGKRVGLLAGAVLLGQKGLVRETVGGMDAPEDVKRQGRRQDSGAREQRGR